MQYYACNNKNLPSFSHTCRLPHPIRRLSCVCVLLYLYPQRLYFIWYIHRAKSRKQKFRLMRVRVYDNIILRYTYLIPASRLPKFIIRRMDSSSHRFRFTSRISVCVIQHKKQRHYNNVGTSEEKTISYIYTRI